MYTIGATSFKWICGLSTSSVTTSIPPLELAMSTGIGRVTYLLQTTAALREYTPIQFLTVSGLRPLKISGRRELESTNTIDA